MLCHQNSFYYPENSEDGQKLNVNGDESLLAEQEPTHNRQPRKSLPCGMDGTAAKNERITNRRASRGKND